MTAVAKDLHRLIRRVGKLTDGQASVSDLDWEDGRVDSFRIEIRPNSGYYNGGVFKFKIELPSDYESDDPPEVYCETDIYHPNIDTTELEYGSCDSNVCLNLLDTGTWNRKFGLEGAVLGLVFLFHNPNLSDPLTPGIDGNIEEFEENVKRYMRGEDVDGRTFDAEFLANIKANEEQDDVVSDKTVVADAAKTEDSENQNEKTPTAGLASEDNTTPLNNTAVTNDGHTATNSSTDVTVGNCEANTAENTNLDTEACNAGDVVTCSNNSAKEDAENEDRLLNQLGLSDDILTDDNAESCTIMSFEEDTVLVVSGSAGVFQEADSETTTEEYINSVTETQTSSQSVPVTVETSDLTSISNCDEMGNTISAIRTIVFELVENAMNKYPEEVSNGACQFITDVGENTSNEIHTVHVNGETHVSETPDISFSRDAKNFETVVSDYTHSVVFDETMVRIPCLCRQESKDHERSRGYFFHRCVSYLKCFLLHTVCSITNCSVR